MAAAHPPVHGFCKACACHIHQDVPTVFVLMPCIPTPQDPFGAGMRVSTRYAYKAGKVCAWMRNPDPRSGTIIGMYLIDVHPKGEDVDEAEGCLSGSSQPADATLLRPTNSRHTSSSKSACCFANSSMLCWAKRRSSLDGQARCDFAGCQTAGIPCEPGAHIPIKCLRRLICLPIPPPSPFPFTLMYVLQGLRVGAPR
jgi:hypothetical protein